jgi:octaprenyl-diphosphate synthase
MANALRQPQPIAPVDAVPRLHALLADDMQAVNALILQKMQNPVALIPQLAAHLIAAGGKRLRPLLTLASAQLCGYRGAAHHVLAAAVEFIHTATLLHDDVVDHSNLRRGQDTANAIWGNKSSVLVGDFLFARAFELMVDANSLPVLRILSNAAATIAQGEVQQLQTANNLLTTADDYYAVIGAKTAALFAAACEVGGIIANRPDAEISALHQYGMELGLAFQLSDDVLDYTGVPGKEPGDDFRDGKITLPVILAFAAGDAVERDFWQRTLGDGKCEDADFATARNILERHNALTQAMEHAQNHAKAAQSALGIFPDSEWRDCLLAAADFAARR